MSKNKPKTDEALAQSDVDCRVSKPFIDLFFTKPLPASNRYHIFRDGDQRSLCGKYGMFRIDPDQCERVGGSEAYDKGQDCKACFRKAKLKV